MDDSYQPLSNTLLSYFEMILALLSLYEYQMHYRMSCATPRVRDNLLRSIRTKLVNFMSFYHHGSLITHHAYALFTFCAYVIFNADSMDTLVKAYKRKVALEVAGKPSPFGHKDIAPSDKSGKYKALHEKFEKLQQDHNILYSDKKNKIADH